MGNADRSDGKFPKNQRSSWFQNVDGFGHVLILGQFFHDQMGRQFASINRHLGKLGKNIREGAGVVLMTVG